MKLATLRDGSRDGRLVVVSRDVTLASDARHIAPNLKAALDDWDRLAPHLDLVARGVESGGQPTERFHEREAMAPLPRAHRFAAASAGGDPQVEERAPDGLLGARDPIRLAEEDRELSIGAAVGVVVADVPMGADRAAALAAIRLVLIMNDPSVRGLAPEGGPAAPALSPVTVTPDELGPAWDGARLLGAISIEASGHPSGRAGSATGVAVDFGDLIVRAARRRPLGAGAIVGSGPLPAMTADGALRAVTLGFGEVVRIEMRDAAGHTIFGAIEQRVERFRGD